MADVRGLVSDPQFNQLSPSEQKTALARVSGDDSFNSLDENSLNEFKTKLTTNNIIPPKVGLRSQSTYEHLTSYLPSKEKVVEFARPIAAAAGMGLGMAIAPEITGPLAGANILGVPAEAIAARGIGFGVSTIGDLLLQGAQGKARQPSTLGSLGNIPIDSNVDKLLSSGEVTVGNEIGAKFINKLQSARKAISEGFPAETREAILTDLKATAAQLSKSPTLKLIEDLFGNKIQAMQRSAVLAKAGFQKEAAQISGVPTLTNPNTSAVRVLQNITDPFAQSLLDSDTAATAAKLRAKQSPTVTTYQEPSGQISKITGLPIIDTKTLNNEGPVIPEKALAWAQDFKNNPKTKPLYKPNEQRELDEAADNILATVKTKFDQNGNPIGTQQLPLDFEQAWRYKKNADALGFAPKGEGDAVSSNMTYLANALNDDIENSIKQQWPQKIRDDALKSWLKAKALVAERKITFQTGDEITNLIKNSQVPKNSPLLKAPLGDIDSIIKDDQVLQRTLNIGAIAQPGEVTPNIRKVLQSHQLNNIQTNAWDPVMQTYDRNKLINQIEDPKMQSSYNILYGDEGVKRLKTYINAVADISERADKLSPWMKINLTKGGLLFAPALLGPLVTNSPIATGAAALDGIVLGTSAVSRLLFTNPERANFLFRAMRGEPLTASQNFVGKLFAGALNGTQMSLRFKDGTSKDVVVKDQKFVPVETQ